jgi:hypothetical protein
MGAAGRVVRGGSPEVLGPVPGNSVRGFPVTVAPYRRGPRGQAVMAQALAAGRRAGRGLPDAPSQARERGVLG